MSPPSAPHCNDQFASNWLDVTKVANTKSCFFELSKTALTWASVSHTFCFAGVDLQVRGCDRDGKYYLKMLATGEQTWSSEAVICVSGAKVENGTTAAAKTEPSRLKVFGELQDLENWEVVVGHGQVEEDDWVKTWMM